MLVISIALILLLLCACIIGVYRVIDSWFLPKHSGEGKIVDKEFTPKHTTITWIATGTTTFPLISTDPDDYSLLIERSGKSDWISVDEEFYKSVHEGQTVKIDYVLGRISKDLYIKEVYW